MWLPLVENVKSVLDVRTAVERNLRHSEPNCTVTALWCEGALCSLPDDVPWRQVIEPGQLLVATGPVDEGYGDDDVAVQGQASMPEPNSTPTPRRDSSLFRPPGTRSRANSAASSFVGPDSSFAANAPQAVDVAPLSNGAAGGAKGGSTPAGHERTVAYIQEQVVSEDPSRERRPSWIVFFANPREVIRRLPGGSWAVFGDVTLSPANKPRRRSWLSRLGRGAAKGEPNA